MGTLVDFLFKKTKAVVADVQFDASIRETHTSECEVTQHVMEEGSVASDHIVEKPDSVEINGVVSNTPLVYLASSLSESPLIGDVRPGINDRVEAAYESLLATKQAKNLVDVVTSLRTYENMAIQSLVTVRDVDKGNVLDCTIRLQEVPIATTELVKIPEPKKKPNKKSVDKGKQVKSKSKPATETKSKTTLASFSDLLSSIAQ